MQEAIDNFQDALSANFRELLLGMAAFELGMRSLQENLSGSVSILVAGGASSEPIHVSTLIHNQDTVKRGNIELFQSKAIALWNDLIVDLYTVSVCNHIDHSVRSAALKKSKVDIDFSLEILIPDQIKNALVRDFSFSNHGSKLDVIKKIFPMASYSSQLSFIKKHVEIRNSFQHHSGIMHAGGLKILGVDKISIKDDDGNDVNVCAGEKIHISVVEIDKLKSALFELSSHMESCLDED